MSKEANWGAAMVIALLAIGAGWLLVKEKGRATPASATPSGVAGAPLSLDAAPSETLTAPMTTEVVNQPESPEETPQEAASVAEGSSEVHAALADITEETLPTMEWEYMGGTMQFSADHQWRVNGQPRSKWEINGDQLRLFDDKGEEHFVEIRGGELVFQGQALQRVK